MISNEEVEYVLDKYIELNRQFPGIKIEFQMDIDKEHNMLVIGLDNSIVKSIDLGLSDENFKNVVDYVIMTEIKALFIEYNYKHKDSIEKLELLQKDFYTTDRLQYDSYGYFMDIRKELELLDIFKNGIYTKIDGIDEKMTYYRVLDFNDEELLICYEKMNWETGELNYTPHRLKLADKNIKWYIAREVER